LRLWRQWLWRIPSSGMWHHVVWKKFNISEEHTAFIFRVWRIRQPVSKKQQWAGACLLRDLTLKMALVLYPKMLLNPCWTTWHHIPEDSTLQVMVLILPVMTFLVVLMYRLKHTWVTFCRPVILKQCAARGG
jgi:hypothetical protein